MQGPLGKLSIQDDEPARYELVVGEERLALNALIGTGLQIEYTGRVQCNACEASSPKSYGGGYCYDCFSRLARCDLCVMSPDRCHYHLGTCREPEWGEAFCMQGHVVYLANATGLKVGITRAQRSVGRWLDQGAVQGLVICRTKTRREAGLIEVEIARNVSDRGDWRKLVSADAPPLDLKAKAEAIRAAHSHLEASWVNEEVVTLRYPISRYGVAERLNLAKAGDGFNSRLIGCKGSYLMFEHGVFNVSAHSGFEVQVNVVDNPPPPDHDDQLSLF